MTDTGIDGQGMAAPAVDGKPCAEPGCPKTVPEGAHPARKYCEDHFVGKHGRSARERASQEKPPKLIVDLGGGKASKKDQRVADTAAGAAAFMNVIATGVSVSGDQVCAAAIANGAGQWGASVGELSKYQPWLQSFFAPVGGENQMGAWLGFLMATGAIVLPVMAHHEMLPQSVGAKLGGVFVAADGAAGDAQQPAA